MPICTKEAARLKTTVASVIRIEGHTSAGAKRKICVIYNRDMRLERPTDRILLRIISHSEFTLEKRLAIVGLTLESVVQMDCLFRDVWNIPVMEKVIRERFNGKYPVRKSIQTNFAHIGGPDGLQFQLDAIAYSDQ